MSEHDHQLHGMHELDAGNTDRNKEHWDKVAKTYNSDNTQKDFGNLINKATEFILANINWIGVDFLHPGESFEEIQNISSKRVRILDYACGPGTITNILHDRATEFIGMDLSPNMVAEYNERFNDDGGLNTEALVVNLLDPAGTPDGLSDARYFDFDLVVVGFGFHHFSNLPLAASRLVERVKAG
ncbi:hypothetical protein LTR66_017801, partial [Elasticomyces elasticus]